MRTNTGGVRGAALVIGLFAVCCGGPLLIGALLATGVGAWLLASGGPVLAAIALLALAVVALWLRQRGWRLTRTGGTDCCALAAIAAAEVKS